MPTLPGGTLIFIVLGKVAKAFFVEEALRFISRGVGFGNERSDTGLFTFDDLFTGKVTAVGDDGDCFGSDRLARLVGHRG